MSIYTTHSWLRSSPGCWALIIVAPVTVVLVSECFRLSISLMLFHRLIFRSSCSLIAIELCWHQRIVTSASIVINPFWWALILSSNALVGCDTRSQLRKANTTFLWDIAFCLSPTRDCNNLGSEVGFDTCPGVLVWRCMDDILRPFVLG